MHSKQLVLGLVVFGQILLTSASPGADLNCSRRSFSWPLHWISSIEFDSQSSDVLLVDPKNNSLVSYHPLTDKFTTVHIDGVRDPTSITKIQGGFLLKEKDDVTFIGPDRRPLGKANLRLAKSGGQSGLGSLYSGWVTSGERFVGFGSVASSAGLDLGHLQFNPSRGFQLGFVSGRISANSDQISDIKILEATEDNGFYLLGFPYFAANDAGLFYVRIVGHSASLVRVRELSNGDLKSEPLAVFPADFKDVPELKTMKDDKASASERFAEIEKSKMVAGLFGQGKFLYLLTRERSPSGVGTKWLLHQIDPEKSIILGTVRLPTSSSFLSMTPAPNDWYIFERKEVRGWGDQDINTVVQVPTVWLSSPASSRLSEKNEKGWPNVDECSRKVIAAQR